MNSEHNKRLDNRMVILLVIVGVVIFFTFVVIEPSSRTVSLLTILALGAGLLRQWKRNN